MAISPLSALGPGVAQGLAAKPPAYLDPSFTQIVDKAAQAAARVEAAGRTAAAAFAGVSDARYEVQRAAQESGARADFKAFMAQTPMERMRAQILGSLGYDEASLGALPPEERAAVEDKIRKIIEEKFREAMREKGYAVDGPAPAARTDVLA